MKKTILKTMYIAAISAIVCLNCGDSGTQSKNLNVGEFLDAITGGGAYYTLTVNVTPSNAGTVSREPGNTRYAAGSEVIVTAAPARGYIFTGWSGASNDTNATVTVTMTGDLSLTANFASTSAPTYILLVNVMPNEGGKVTREPNKTRYNAGETVTVTAEALDGYTFTGWSGASNDLNPVVTVAMTGDLTLNANFQQHTYALTLGANPATGGTVSREPYKTGYAFGEQVTATATPAPGYKFTGWTGASTSANESVMITMDGNKTLTARFERLTYTLTTKTTPTNGGSISRSPNKDSYAYGEQVTVTAVPSAGYAFNGWTGAVTSTSAGVTVTMDGDRELTANFKTQTAPSYTLTTVASHDIGAAITRNPDKASYQQGETVTVTAPTATGYTFTGWSGASSSANSTVTVTIDENKALTANYTPINYTLTVDAFPTAGGTVSRNPNNSTYTHNQSVTVTATPSTGYKFTGWSGASSSANSTVTVTMDGNKTLTANFEALTYTLETCVSQNIGGAVSRSPNKDIYTHGEQVTVIATPSTGYTFTGWSGASSSTNATVTITMNDNKTLTAYFQQTLYMLTTNVSPANGGTVSRSPNQTTYTAGTSVTVTATPASGYIFKGWTGASLSTNSTITISMDGEKTLTASFGLPDAKRFTVYFNGNGTTGGTAPTAITADSGSSITLPDQQTMEKNGYSFDGWNTSNMGTGTQYAAFASYKVTGEVTLYAKWIPIHTVTFSGNGATAGVPQAVNANSGSSITLPAQGNMTRTGYSFGGWNTSANGTGTQYAALSSYTVTGNATIYAKWIPIYTVTFNANGGTDAPSSISADSGTAITIPAKGGMARTGNTFGRWNTSANGSGTNYNAGASYTVTGNVTIYAKWIPIYTVTYNGNDNTSGSVAATQADSGTAITISGQETLTRTNYKFSGWNTNTGGTGTNYSAGASYTVTGNVTLYAKWTAYPTYTITYNGNGNTSGSVSATSADSSSTVTLAGQGTLVKTGYNFAGWNTNNLGTGTNYSAEGSYTVTGNVTLYAMWTIKKYTVTYNGNGNTGGNVPAAITVDSGTVITLPNQGALVKTGHHFGGWNTKNDGTGTNYSAGGSYTITGNVTIYAKWAAIYTLTTTVSPSGGGTILRNLDQEYYTAGTSVTVTAMAASDYTFTGWSGASTSTTASVTITMDGNKTLTANFIPTYVLTTYVLTFGSGSVSRSPDQTNYISGTSVTVTATASSGYIFTGWGGALTTTSPNVTIMMDENKTLYAHFEPIYTLTINTYPSDGGSVLRNPNQAYYIPGTEVTLTVTPASGYKFVEWLGAKFWQNSTNPMTISMDSNRTLTVNFVQYGTFTDTRNSKTYKTVKIGNQTWMAENLNYQPSIDDTWCYDNSAENCNRYGRLYNWNTAMTICPFGWHLPSIEEWDKLIESVNGGKRSNSSGTVIQKYSGAVGITLKSTGGWSNTIDNNCKDDYGFSALPGGALYGNGFKHGGINGEGFWWTSTEIYNSRYHINILGTSHEGFAYLVPPTEFPISVRCVQNN